MGGSGSGTLRARPETIQRLLKDLLLNVARKSLLTRDSCKRSIGCRCEHIYGHDNVGICGVLEKRMTWAHLIHDIQG